MIKYISIIFSKHFVVRLVLAVIEVTRLKRCQRCRFSSSRYRNNTRGKSVTSRPPSEWDKVTHLSYKSLVVSFYSVQSKIQLVTQLHEYQVSFGSLGRIRRKVHNTDRDVVNQVWILNNKLTKNLTELLSKQNNGGY